MTAPGPIDSHCHLQLIDADERERVLDAARERGVRGFLSPGIVLDDVDTLLALCEQHEDVWCSVGVHPSSSTTWRDGDQERIAALARHPKVVAIGECGLDFFYDRAPREHQIEVMRAQWAVAVDLGLPVIVHNRESNEAMLEALRAPEHATLGVDLHSFAGGLAMAEEALARGAYLGMSGMITFPKADNVREVLPVTPPERLLVETDAPYLAPVPYRGQPNRPAYVVEVLERLARELGRPAAEVAALTCDNFFRLFAKAAP